MTTAAARTGLHILIVDDNPTDAELLQLLLHDHGVAAEFAYAKNSEQLRMLLQTLAPDVVVSDINMPGFGGAQAHAMVRQLRPHARFCFMSDAAEYTDDLPSSDALLRKDQIKELIMLLNDWFSMARG